MFLDTTLKKIFQYSNSIAIIGAKDKPGQAVNMVGQYLLSAGFKVYPVHPVRKNVWGLQVYKNLAELPVPVDIINVFRASPYCLGHAQDVLKLDWKPKCFWMQLGIHSKEALEVLSAKGIRTIENLCIKIEHERLM